VLSDLIYCYKLSKQCHAKIYIKLENTQIVKSFKIRGAANALMHLNKQQKKHGVIAASAGNHAQGVAYAASQMGIKATIVMPSSAPLSKINATTDFGAQVVLAPSPIFDDANKLSQELAKKNNFTLIPPYDNRYVIAGQGTIGLEILKQHPEIDTIIVQIGGGGLISGITIAAKSIKPDIRIIGVQVENFPAMYNNFNKTSLKTKRLYVPTIADGISVKQPSQYAASIVKKYVDQVVTVTNEEVEDAIRYIAEVNKIIVEGAGATGFAAILANKVNVANRHVAVIASGGNIDVDRFIQSINRSLAFHQRRFFMTFNYRPQDLSKLLSALQSAGAKAYDGISEKLITDQYPQTSDSVRWVIFLSKDSDQATLFVKLKKIGIKYKITNCLA
jgi:threonine dehydratase